MRDGQNTPRLTRRLTRRISGDVTRLEAHNAATTEYDPTLGLRIKIDVESHSGIERRQGGLPMCYGRNPASDRMLRQDPCIGSIARINETLREFAGKLEPIIDSIVRKSYEQTCLKRYSVREWVSREYQCGRLRTSEAGGTYYVDPGG